MGKLIHRLRRDESGATAMEYGLIVALISVIVIGAVNVTGKNLWNELNTVSQALRGS